ncbi:hypothetical protein C8A01DRAFT_42127, partial [Parachaetomium inaequale]
MAAALFLLSLLPLLPTAWALSSAEDWSSFADNFATDLAPLITLFGEQVTKQFLSESVGFLDNLIFGLGPLGILTAVVSAIRLYGRASLKSFIGRAQEAHGIAEAELCSSTSHDVCELWSNGGICRVFGRPKILEFIYTRPQPRDPANFKEEVGEDPPHCGIYTPREVLVGNTPDGSSDYWTEVPRPFPFRKFAPFPDLSLNVGTRRTSKRFLLGAVAAGVLLEASFFFYATWATFYNPDFYTGEDAPHLWSFVLGMAGTVFLMFGMCLCAVLVERRSLERRFKTVKRPDDGGVKPRLFWVQCGDQRVGDQQFRSFAYSDEKQEYMTSYVSDPKWDRVFGFRPSSVLWVAIVASLLGFACQFVGFRGLHGSITLYQLACTLVMSVVRALLRSRRLGREQNRLEYFSRKSESDELDWQALSIVGSERHIQAEDPLLDHTDLWTLMNSHLDTGLRHSPSSKAAQSILGSSVDILLSKGVVGSGVVGFRPADTTPEAERETVCAQNGVKFVRMLEGSVRHGDFVVEPLAVEGSPRGASKFNMNPAARALNIRARLGHLTGDAFQPPGTQWDPELQSMARRLRGALQDAMGYIFDKAPLQPGWKGAKTLVWSATCTYSVVYGPRLLVEEAFPVYFLMHQKSQRWQINEYQLAAVMGLWRHSLFQSFDPVEAKFPARHVLKRKLIQVAGTLERTAAVMRLWVTKDGTLSHRYASLKEQGTADLVPFRLSLEEVERVFTHEGRWEPYAHDGDAPEDPGPSAVLLMSLLTPGTLLEMIAQDVFTAFMFEAASMLDKLTEVSVRQPLGAPSDASILRNPNSSSSDLSNPHVDALARILYDAGLATEEAALMCVVPAMFHHSKLPSLDDSAGRLLSDAKQLRTDRQYEKGEAHLKSLLRICSPQHHEKVVRALGELYRAASKSPSGVHRDFGLRAMASIRRNTISQAAGPTLSEAAMTAVADYEKLAEFLPKRSGNSWESRTGVFLRVSEVLRLEGIRQPGQESERSRLKTLLVLEKYDMTSRNSPALHELLFAAIALGHDEVFDDLHALNRDLVFEPPSLKTTETGLGAAPLTAFLTRKFNAGNNLASRGGSTVGFLALAWAASQLEDGGHSAGEAEDILRTVLDWASATKEFTDVDKNTPLMYAVGSGNLKAVNVFLESGVDFQVLNIAGETALSRAVSVGNVSIAERILKEGHERASLPHVYLHHALSVALRAHKQPFIDLLVQNGANINDRDERGHGLLFAALEPFLPETLGDGPYKHINTRGNLDRDPELLTLLLKNGATTGDLLPDILQAAIDNVMPDWIRELHARGSDVISPLAQMGGVTAILEAAIPSRQEVEAAFPREPEKRHRSDPLIELLLELGMPVQPGDIHRAVRLRSSEQILVSFLKNGASNNTVLEGYGTPLQTLLNNEFWDSRAAAQERMLDLLLTNGCDVNLDSPEWKATPLQIVCSRSDFHYEKPLIYHREALPEYSDKLPMMLLRAGANVNLTAADIPGAGRRLIKSTPLELACLTGKTEVVLALLEAGAKVNTPGGEFGPPLQAACIQFGREKQGAVEIIRALIKAGADLNALCKPGGTPLAVAAHLLLPELVKTLLDAGAAPTLDLKDHTDGAYADAWDALHQPPGPLVETLQKAFSAMQTGPFDCEVVERDAEESRKRWREIKALFALHGIVRPGERREVPADDYFQSDNICFQEEFAHLSSEEIRLSDYTVGPRYGPELPPAIVPNTTTVAPSPSSAGAMVDFEYPQERSVFFAGSGFGSAGGGAFRTTSDSGGARTTSY